MSKMNPRSISYNRQNCKVLVVCSNGERSSQLRQCMKTLGFGEVSAAPNHTESIERFKFRKFTHVMFDAASKEMPVYDFVKLLLDLDEECILIAVSESPRVDDVFGLLRSGARHFLVVPFTIDALEDVLLEASEGPPLSEAVLNAPDRNTALTGVILNTLYRQTVLMRQAREYPTAARELEWQTRKLEQSIDMAKMFCEGDDDALVEALVEGCIARANVAATRLGRTRKKLRSKRQSGAEGEGDEDDEEEEEASPSA